MFWHNSLEHQFSSKNGFYYFICEQLVCMKSLSIYGKNNSSLFALYLEFNMLLTFWYQHCVSLIRLKYFQSL